MFIYKGIYIYILHVYISVLVLTDHGQKWQTGTRKITKTGQDLQAGSEKKTTLHLLPELSPWRGWRKLLKPCREHPESWSLDCLCLGSRFAWSVFFRTQSAFQILTRYIWFSQQRMHCSRTHHKTPRYWLVFKRSSGKKNHQPKYKAL